MDEERIISPELEDVEEERLEKDFQKLEISE